MSGDSMGATRNGKIARLPKDIREELNRRLEDGEPGKHLVAWLNEQEPVRTVLQGQFGGRPVSEQNLSEWKAGGFREWLRHEETRLLVSSLTEQSEALEDAADGVAISDCGKCCTNYPSSGGTTTAPCGQPSSAKSGAGRWRARTNKRTNALTRKPGSVTAPLILRGWNSSRWRSCSAAGTRHTISRPLFSKCRMICR